MGTIRFVLKSDRGGKFAVPRFQLSFLVLLTRITDTSAAEARAGKDIQGIPWERLQITRQDYRKARLEQYKNYENFPQSGELMDKLCKQVESSSKYYEFQYNTRIVKPSILHFQWLHRVSHETVKRIITLKMGNGEPDSHLNQTESKPALFLLKLDIAKAFDSPLKILKRVTNDGILSQLSSRHARFRVSICADDVALFINPVRSEVDALHSVLAAFGDVSGLRTSFSESTSFHIHCPNLDINDTLASFLRDLGSLPCSYLGLPSTSFLWSGDEEARELNLLLPKQFGGYQKSGKTAKFWTDSWLNVGHWSSLSHKMTDVLDFSGHVAPAKKHPGCALEGFTGVQVSTLAVNEGLLVAGGFQGELVCKSLGERDVKFCTRTTLSDNAITNAMDIHRSTSGSLRITVSNNDSGVREFDMERFQLLNHFRFNWPVNVTSTLVGHLDYSFASAWHPDGVTFATGNQDKTCRVWDIRNPSTSLAVLRGNIGAIRCIRYSSDGRFLLFSEPADFVHVYSAAECYRKRQEIDFFGEISGISLSPDDKSLFVGVCDRVYASLLNYRMVHANGYLDSYM
ncbi:unnamed protein product [Triticum turgidum subsp. durum]|uniref:Uncharacterized protein n=1 Tax=Triticum turgidum subsp. durum TaxID=4567 RepID=A0A9R1BJI1_TRITD|nr:unnamed protein product [Triticum turgidum subsp. durum]